MPRRLIPVLSLISAVILLVMLNFTTPVGVGPLGVLVFFTTFYMLMYGLAMLIVRAFAKVLGDNVGKKQYLYGAVLAFGPMILLMLAPSLGVLNPAALGLMTVFVALGCFLVKCKL